MQLEDLVAPDSVLCNAQARSKKHCLEILSELIARPVSDVSGEDVFESLITRERLGCTSLDQGVAFPHCRVEGLTRSIGALVKLSEPVDFDSPDGEPVDIVFGLAVPEQVEPKQLADVCNIADLLGDRVLRSKLRAAKTSQELYEAICG